MKIKNKIISYFVLPPTKSNRTPRVFRSPVTMSNSTARDLIGKQLKKKGEGLPQATLLHVCFDVDSDRVYVLNSAEFNPEQMKPLMDASLIRISKDYGGYASSPIIEGSPFSSIRARKISSFPYAHKMIQQHYGDKIFTDIPVIEANLERMPSTLKALPDVLSQESGVLGVYVGPSFGSSINFIDELDNNGNKREKPILLLQQNTPFILINYNRQSEPRATEKEGVVIASYRDYLYDDDASSEEKYISEDISRFADLYAIKQHLYLGFPFEEVCRHFISERYGVTNWMSLTKAINRLMLAVKSFEEEGHKSPITPYYITFKIDIDTFPFKLESITDKTTGRMSPALQNQYLRVLDYDAVNSYVIIETTAFIDQDMCSKIFKAQSPPIITSYNDTYNTIDVKSDDSSYKALDRREKKQTAKMRALNEFKVEKQNDEKIEFRTGPSAQGQWATDPNIFNTRRVSDYYYAADYIYKMCEQLDIEFRDLDVITGPIEKFFGQGTQGGYMDGKGLLEQGIKTPHEIEPGLWMNPPLILINTRTTPAYPEQTETIVHEYRHYIFGVQNPNYKKQYGDMSSKKGKEFLREWWLYLTDPNEVAAHKTEIRYALLLGKSVDEIIRDKVEGQVSTQNYPIALKFRELVEEVVDELGEEGEMDEQPTE